MKNTKLRPLTESSLLTAITVIIAMAGIYIPFIILFWTLPITIITAKHNLKYGIFSALIASILLCVFLTPVTAIPLVVASIIGVCLFLICTFYLTGINLFVDQLDAFKTAMLDTNEMFNSMGITSEAMIDAQRQTQHLIETLALVLPMIFILNAVIKLVINYIASSFLLKRLGTTNINSLPPFRLWRFPKVFIYIYAFSLIGMYWGDTRSITLLYQIALNTYLCANVLGLVQGLSVIRFFYKLKNWPTAVWIFIIIMLCLNMIIAQIIALAGFFDMIFDYRKKFKNSNDV